MAGLLDLLTKGAMLGRDSDSPYAQATHDAIVGALQNMMTLPQRAFQSSEAMRQGYGYNPAPILGAATLPMGTGALAGVPARAGDAILGSGLIRTVQQPSMAVPQELQLAHALGQKVKAARDNWRMADSPTGDFWADVNYGHSPSVSSAEADQIAKLQMNDPVSNAFFESGRRGHDMPVYTTGKRFGPAPEQGVSRNYREQENELGVSMAQVEHPEFKDYEWPEIGGGRKQPVHSYEGWLLPFKGSDEEPLMVGLKRLAENAPQSDIGSMMGLVNTNK